MHCGASVSELYGVYVTQAVKYPHQSPSSLSAHICECLDR